jgi:hypothetical protein
MMKNATALLTAAGLEMPDVTSQTIQQRIAEAHEQAQPILFLLSDWYVVFAYIGAGLGQSPVC